MPLPSFSIIIETANMRDYKLSRLSRMLDSLAAQDRSPADADRVILLEDGTMPPEFVGELCARHPWLETRRINPCVAYGDQKAIATRSLESDVLLFADCDCTYEPGWVSSTLESFAERPDVGVVAGETETEITGPYTLAVALFFYFPRFSGERELTRARGMFLNNAALRRETLARCPFPADLPVRRGQNVIFSRLLLGAGIPIWRQPRARSVHSPPGSLWHGMQLLFFAGRDGARFDALAPLPAGEPWAGDYEPYHRPAGRFGKVARRLRDIARQQPGVLPWLPLALPIAATAMGAFFLGRALERAYGLWGPPIGRIEAKCDC